MTTRSHVPKPIRVFYSTLSRRFYASAHWRVEGGRGVVVITGKKYDVTDDIASMVLKYDLEFHLAEEGEESIGLDGQGLHPSP